MFAGSLDAWIFMQRCDYDMWRIAWGRHTGWSIDHSSYHGHATIILHQSRRQVHGSTVLAHHGGLCLLAASMLASLCTHWCDCMWKIAWEWHTGWSTDHSSYHGHAKIVIHQFPKQLIRPALLPPHGGICLLAASRITSSCDGAIACGCPSIGLSVRGISAVQPTTQ